MVQALIIKTLTVWGTKCQLPSVFRLRNRSCVWCRVQLFFISTVMMRFVLCCLLYFPLFSLYFRFFSVTQMHRHRKAQHTHKHKHRKLIIYSKPRCHNCECHCFIWKQIVLFAVQWLALGSHWDGQRMAGIRRCPIAYLGASKTFSDTASAFTVTWGACRQTKKTIWCSAFKLFSFHIFIQSDG